MRRAWLLILLVLPAAGQDVQTAEEQPDAVYAPIQVLLDQFPVVMRMAIDEARFDGTPQDAEERIAQMQAFFAGFEAAPPWPEGSIAAASGARDAFGIVGGLLDAAEAIPPNVARLSQVDAGCRSVERITGGQLRDWWQATGQDVGALDELRGTLRGLANQIKAPLSAAPVLSSVGQLDAWLIGIANDVQFCLEEAFVTEGLEIPEGDFSAGLDGEAVLEPFIRVQVDPSPAYPGAEVVVTGRVVGPRGFPAHIKAPGLGWDTQVPTGAFGTFDASFMLPADIALGQHSVQAESNGIVGEATVVIDRAPVHIHASGPDAVLAGQEYVVRVSASSPLSVSPAARLTVDGDEVPFTGTVLRFTAPDDPGSRVHQITYAGDGTHHPAAATVRVRIEAPVAIAPVDEGESLWEVLEKGIWFGPENAIGLRGAGQLLRPQIETGAMLLITFAIVVFVLLDLAISNRKAGPADVIVEDAVEPLQWPRSFVVAFAAISAFMIRRGILPAGATPRDVGRRMAASGGVSKGLVTEFEFVRYGGRKMPDPLEADRVGWAKRIWQKMGGQ